MGIIKEEEIAGYHIGEEVVCQNCFSNADSQEMTEDEIITINEVEKSDKRYFCDRCKKEL